MLMIGVKGSRDVTVKKKKKADIWSTRNSDTHCNFRKSKKYLILMGF